MFMFLEFERRCSRMNAAIINTRRMTDRLAEELTRRGHKEASLHVAKYRSDKLVIKLAHVEKSGLSISKVR